MTGRVTDDRYERACVEAIDLVETVDSMYRVENSSGLGDGDGGGYVVGVVGGSCTCPDAQYRGDDVVCKHAIRAALVHVYRHGVTSRFVARVVAFSHEAGCPVDGTDCNGPVGVETFPCPTCVDAVRSPSVDEWDVWCQLVEKRPPHGTTREIA